MAELFEVPQFNLDHYIQVFKKKKKFHINNLDDIDVILNSDEYLHFINAVYAYCNSSLQDGKERLDIKFYYNADNIINNFWDKVIGSELFEEYTARLQSKLRI